LADAAKLSFDGRVHMSTKIEQGRIRSFIKPEDKRATKKLLSFCHRRPFPRVTYFILDAVLAVVLCSVHEPVRGNESVVGSQSGRTPPFCARLSSGGLPPVVRPQFRSFCRGSGLLAGVSDSG
jgi:hypothetical protein